jgi:hypothetical protein
MGSPEASASRLPAPALELSGSPPVDDELVAEFVVDAPRAVSVVAAAASVDPSARDPVPPDPVGSPFVALDVDPQFATTTSVASDASPPPSTPTREPIARVEMWLLPWLRCLPQSPINSHSTFFARARPEPSGHCQL